MEFTIWVEKSIEVPDDDIKSLVKRTNKRFGIKPSSSAVYPEDLIRQAMLDGIIETIDENWHVDDSESDDMVNGA